MRTVELPRALDDVLTHEIMRSIEENHTATALTVSFFSIVDDGASTMAKALRTNSNIQKLQVRDIRNQREINLFFKDLDGNRDLHELSMRHTRICPKSVGSVGRFLRNHPRLEEVRLVDTQLVDLAFSDLCCELKGSSVLKCLYLVNNELQPKEIQSLAIFLSDIVVSLQELHLCENDVNDEDVLVLAEQLSKSDTIHLLDFRSNRISVLGAASIQGILISNVNLTSLCLANNELGNMGVAALARGLHYTGCRLQILNVAGNGCDSKSADSIASMLKHNKSMIELNLSFNDLGDCGAVVIAQSLGKNTSLQKLQMRKIGMTCTGAIAFGECLPRMMFLKELILTSNIILEKGGTALMEGLVHNVNLEYLLLDGKMHEITSREIARLIRLNRAGRRVFRQDDKVNPSLWPSIYGRFSRESDIVHYFVREKPEILGAFFTNDRASAKL
ncbi:hypothetical protein ACA910_004845 [Epithemia clementina (nom. ined.)]